MHWHALVIFIFAAQLGTPNICSALSHNLVSAKSGSQHLEIVNAVGVAVAVAAGVGVGARFDLQSMNALCNLCNTFFLFFFLHLLLALTF